MNLDTSISAKMTAMRLLPCDATATVRRTTGMAQTIPDDGEAKIARQTGMQGPLTGRMFFFGDISQEKQDKLLALAAQVDSIG